MKKLVILVQLFSLLPLLGHAADYQLKSTERKAISQSLDQAEVFNKASIGKLNDDKEYLSVLFRTQEEAEKKKLADSNDPSVTHCALFSRNGKELQLEMRTPALTIDGPRDLVVCELRQQALNIYHRNANTLWSETNEVWRFQKTSSGELQLVQYDLFSSEDHGKRFNETGQSIKFSSNQMDIWYVSGRAIQKDPKGERQYKPFSISKIDRQAHQKLDIQFDRKFSLANFELNAFNEYLKTIPQTNTYIDENLKVKQREKHDCLSKNGESSS